MMLCSNMHNGCILRGSPISSRTQHREERVQEVNVSLNCFTTLSKDLRLHVCSALSFPNTFGSLPALHLFADIIAIIFTSQEYANSQFMLKVNISVVKVSFLSVAEVPEQFSVEFCCLL